MSTAVTAASRSPIRRAVHLLSVIFAVLSALTVVIVTVLILVDVFLRNTATLGVRGAAEIVELSMPLIAYLAFAYAQQTRSHVASTLLTSRLGPIAHKVVVIIGLLVTVFFTFMLCWATFDAFMVALETGQQRAGILNAATWPSKLAIFAGCVALFLEVLVQTVDTFAGRPDRADLISEGGDNEL